MQLIQPCGFGIKIFLLTRYSRHNVEQDLLAKFGDDLEASASADKKSVSSLLLQPVLVADTR